MQKKWEKKVKLRKWKVKVEGKCLERKQSEKVVHKNEVRNWSQKLEVSGVKQTEKIE